MRENGMFCVLKTFFLYEYFLVLQVMNQLSQKSLQDISLQNFTIKSLNTFPELSVIG